LRLLLPLRNVAWRGAKHCVTLGHDMASVLARARVPSEKVTLIPNWAPTGLAPLPVAGSRELRSEWNLTGKFVVVYSGNFGRVHDLVSVLNVAALLREDPDIAFVLIGDGAQRKVLEALAVQFSLSNLIFRPPQPRTRLQQALALGDIHLVTMRAGCETLVFPSKLYGIAAIGRPVIFIGPKPCEVAALVENEGFGQAFAASEAAAIVIAIRRLKHDPSSCEKLSLAATRFATSNGGATAAAVRWSALLDPARELATPSRRT
jgi:colanic acid biosynthesis glycosyl transferase WcaI